MNINVTESPQKWVIVKITGEDEKVHYKVFGSWSGGYLDGDSWKLNSGISKVDEDEENFYFHGFSGSCYKCRKGKYGIATAYSVSVLDSLIERALITDVLFTVLEDSNNWKELINKADE